MKKYIIRTETGEKFNAASKARLDADSIAAGLGYEPFPFEGGRTAKGSAAGALRLAALGLRNWRRLIRGAEPGSLILFQYPHYPMKSALLAGRMIPLARRKKNLRFAALVHDLDSLRGMHGRAAVYSDERVLPLFDAVICHNERMKAYLTGKGIPEDKIITLGLFDYLTEAGPSCAGSEPGIAVAGNLSAEKSGYVHRLIESAGSVPVHLFGKGLEGTGLPESAVYYGSFPPEELPGRLKGRYGLVWDGNTLETCAGKTGEYLRFNNPHKLSLYMAAGLPVIVWDQAAVADFVREQGVGIPVSSLGRLEEALSSVTEDQYREMKRRAEAVGQKVRAGEYLSEALRKAEYLSERRMDR